VDIVVNKKATLTGHTDCIYTLESGPDANLFFSSGGDGMVVMWDVRNPEQGELILKVPGSVYALKFIPETSLLVTGHNFEGIHLVDINTRERTGSLKIGTSAIFDISFENDKLFVATGEGSLFVVGLDPLKILQKIQLSEKSLRCVRIIPERNEIAIGSSDNFIRILELKTLKLKKEIDAHTNSVFALNYNNRTNSLLSGSRDAHLKFWNAGQNYEQEEKIVAHMYAINDIKYRSDGRLFATGSMDKTIKIWNASDNRLLKVLDKNRHGGHSTSVNKLFWSNHMDLLISCSDDRTISIWDITINN
jgi:WD40 repeat protein